MTGEEGSMPIDVPGTSCVPTPSARPADRVR